MVSSACIQMPSFAGERLGTRLAAGFTPRDVRTVLVARGAIGACVRASAVAAMGRGSRPVVISDCGCDRAIGPHEANRYDLAQTGAWIASLCDVLKAVAAGGRGWWHALCKPIYSAC
ncbi:isochorismatase family protein [Ramlibacter sp. AW1]|uniref:Isochorismatase family protein n=2 Tax=Ramlibacter aurantiacus TaxID=2801330 RepID=A0A936ZJS8_9BURK|nr:isochorismatase family protein [Ramlibacter aurantiacus]